MNIHTTADADHRISSGKSLSFKKGRTYTNQAKTVAEALIQRGVAREATEAEVKAFKKEG